jgi:hypothetical protein
MKKLYTYYPEFDDQENLMWHVLETGTEQVISSFFFEDDAEEYSKFLEKGGAFAGFTPSFVLKKTHSYDINDAFAAEFAE